MRAAFCILSVCMLFLLGSAHAAPDTVGDLPAGAARCIGAADGNMHGEVTFAIPPGQSDARTTDPVIALKPDQSCEIPALALRLLEQGTMALKARILSDGTMADVQVVSPFRNQYLNNATLRLAQTELKFSPAINNGMPIDVERVLNVTLRIVFDPLWLADPSLKNPAPSEQLAFGLDWLALGHDFK
ncbi:MAG TPA: TonB family protein [Micropepsaceae bacterium]|nr:TonB family protein [Micropepsaceae bacterium]